MKIPAPFHDADERDERDELRWRIDCLGGASRELAVLRRDPALASYLRARHDLPELPSAASIVRACEALDNAQACLAQLYGQRRRPSEDPEVQLRPDQPSEVDDDQPSRTPSHIAGCMAGHTYFQPRSHLDGRSCA